MSLNKSFEFISHSEEETRRLGVVLGDCAYCGLVLLLYGGLGAGKTMLTQGIGQALGIRNVKSPTFIIISEHDGGRLPLIHADLYRIENSKQADALDLENYIDQKCLLVVEWAENWPDAPTDDCIDIFFGLPCNEKACSRILKLSANGIKAEKMLERVMDKMLKNKEARKQ